MELLIYYFISRAFFGIVIVMDKSFDMLTEKIAERTARYNELVALTEAPEIIADNKLWRKYVLEKTALERSVTLYEELKVACDLGLAEEASALSDELAITLLDQTDADRGGALMELDARDDASCRLASEMLTMYSAYCKKEKFDFAVIDEERTPAGISRCSVSVEGVSAYLKLSGEIGLHRSTDGGTVTVTVLPTAETQDSTEIDPKDVRTDIFHATGAGGQNINKVATAVRMTHLPTGIVAVCRDERSQLRNRERCKQALSAKVNAYYREAEDAKRLKLKRDSDAAAKLKRIRLFDRKNGTLTDVRTLAKVDLKEALDGNISKLVNAMIILNKL